MINEEEDWELSPENCNPRATSLLTDDFYWDCADDNSPFGNDTGADTLAQYREWRVHNPQSNPILFLDQLLEDWEVSNDHWDVTDPADVKELLEEDQFSFIMRDDAIIGLAFGQLLLEGKVDVEVKRRANTALQRQALPAVLAHRNWVDLHERLQRLGKMAKVIEVV
jgi:uncharacterized protein YfeS